MKKFMIGTKPNAARISHEKWESQKDVILEKYQTSTLQEVQDFMKEEHNFFATLRQYGHRVRDVWKVNKYKHGDREPAQNPLAQDATQPRPDPAPVDASDFGREASDDDAEALLPAVVEGLPVVPILLLPTPTLPEHMVCELWFSTLRLDSPADVKIRYLWLADMLAGLGDFYNAFRIIVALWHTGPLNAYLVACVNAAQAQPQWVITRELTRKADENLDADECSWARWFMDFLHAYTYERDGRPGSNWLAQVTNILDNLTEADGEGCDRLTKLTPRLRQGLDTPMYVLLCSALVGYNSTYKTYEHFRIVDILNQFITQHLPSVIDGLDGIGAATIPEIDCLRECLRWCAAMLPSLPGNTSNDGNPSNGHATIASEIFTVLCSLWSFLLQQSRGLLFDSCTDVPARTWVVDAEAQLGIHAPQLLSIVVYMIISVALGQETDTDRPVLERMLAATEVLNGQSDAVLLCCFLNQACTMSWQLVDQSDSKPGFSVRKVYVDPEVMEPFRERIAGWLEVPRLLPVVAT